MIRCVIILSVQKLISFPFVNHPIVTAPPDTISDYLNILFSLAERFGDESVTEKWSKFHSRFSNGSNGKAVAPVLSDDDLVAKIRKFISRWPFFRRQGLRSKTLCYALVCDILFITAFNNVHQAQKIIDYLQNVVPKSYQNKIKQLTEILYNDAPFNPAFDSVKTLVEYWHLNLKFCAKPLKRILMTGTTSAGKSSLINALLGKDVCRFQNAVCTDEVKKIYNKPFQDGIECSVFSENFAQTPLCFIDTPGINAAQFPEHHKITCEEISKGEYDAIMCVVNGTQIDGSTDEYKHFEYIAKFQHAKIIFAVNKLDDFDDDINKAIERVRVSLVKTGIANPVVYPVSAKAGRIAKKMTLEDKYAAYEADFAKPRLRLSQYYDFALPESLLSHCGIAGLEKIIAEA